MAMSVRQTKGSQCDLDWSIHALNEGVNLSGVLLCQQCQQDKPAPVTRKVRNVTDFSAIREDDYLHISTARTFSFPRDRGARKCAYRLRFKLFKNIFMDCCRAVRLCIVIWTIPYAKIILIFIITISYTFFFLLNFDFFSQTQREETDVWLVDSP
jgi:hypothetical protein